MQRTIFSYFTDGEVRLITANTPQILSSTTRYWLSWEVDAAHVRCIRLDTNNDGSNEGTIINWPIPLTFSPRRISALAGAHVQLR